MASKAQKLAEYALKSMGTKGDNISISMPKLHPETLAALQRDERFESVRQSGFLGYVTFRKAKARA